MHEHSQKMQTMTRDERTEYIAKTYNDTRKEVEEWSKMDPDELLAKHGDKYFDYENATAENCARHPNTTAWDIRQHLKE